MYSSRRPGIEASAIVTCTPRTSAGSGRGCGTTSFGFTLGFVFAVATNATSAGLCVTANANPDAPAMSIAPPATATIRRLRFFRARSCRRSRNCSFGSTGVRTTDVGTYRGWESQ